MFNIGEFAQLCGTTTRTLRYYQSCGLFEPAWIDPANSYRYYAADQIPTLNRIRALRDLDVPVPAIGVLIRAGGDLDAAIRDRCQELADARSEIDRKLSAVGWVFDPEGLGDIVVRDVDPVPAATIRFTLSGADIDLEPWFDEIEAHVAAHRARADRPPALILHDRERHDYEIVIPICNDVAETDMIGVRTIPGCTAASTIVMGGYDRLHRAHDRLTGWAWSGGHRSLGPARVVYLQFSAAPVLQLPDRFMTSSADGFVTELLLPLT